MGTKNNPGEYDCYKEAFDDEPMFTLLARDPLAPTVVRIWALLRKLERGDDDDDIAKIMEAKTCADEMEKWYEDLLKLAEEEDG